MKQSQRRGKYAVMIQEVDSDDDVDVAELGD